MKKPKVKRRTHKAAAKRAPCSCHKNSLAMHYIDEVAEKVLAEDGSAFHKELEGSFTFSSMVAAAEDDDVSPCCLLSDAIRLGYAAGKLHKDVKHLEQMVGIAQEEHGD